MRDQLVEEYVDDDLMLANNVFRAKTEPKGSDEHPHPTGSAVSARK